MPPQPALRQAHLRRRPGRPGGAVQSACGSFVAQGVGDRPRAVVSTGWEPVLRDAEGRQHSRHPRRSRHRDDRSRSSTSTLIASDFVEEGRMAARWLAERTNGTCNIVELQGTTGSAPAIDRQRGFAEIVAQHPGMKVVKSQSADFERAKGKEVMEAFIKSVGRSGGGAINAVYAHNDDMALGAIQALEEAGMKPGTDVLVVSIDAVRPAFDAMVAGTLNASVECNPLLGPLAFDAIDRLRRGETLPKFMKQEDRLFVKEKAADEIAKREY
ncbi:MAG: ABC transporter substrate-binding protein [Phycisphaerales bacterium]